MRARNVQREAKSIAKRYRPLAYGALVVLIGCLASSLLSFQLERARLEGIERDFTHLSSMRAERIAESFGQAMGELETMHRFIANSTFVTEEEFLSFSAPWIGKARLAALYWFVPDTDGSYSLRYAAEGIETPLPRASAVASLVGAFARESAAARAPRSLLFGDSAQSFIAVALPASTLDGPASGTSAGCLVGVLDPCAIVERIVDLEPPLGLPVWLKSEEGTVYFHPPRLDKSLGTTIESGFSPRIYAEPVEIKLPDPVALRVEIGASPAFFALRENPAPLIIALMGAAVSILLGIWASRLEKTRRDAEEKAESLGEQLERFFDMGIDLFCIADIQGRFRKLNVEWERCLGYRLADLEGATFLDFVHDEDRASTIQAIERLSRGNSVESFVNRYRAKDGSYRFIEWRSTPSADGTLIYAAARDISARIEAAEALESSLAQREALLKELHHRVKNNLQVLSSFASLERDGAEDRDPGKMLMDLSARIQAMALAHEKLSESGGFETVPLAEYLRDLAAQLVAEHASGRIGLTSEIEDARVSVDLAIPLGIIVAELVTNAITYAFGGVDEPRLSLYSTSRAGMASIAVKDNGRGLSACEGREGLGRKVIEALAAQIGGSFRYVAEATGCTGEIRFPLSARG
jgi:PAS domain S-box-containing protein